ncbi:hypothetical protein S245_038204 [Arachis hypogaea]
MKSEGASYPGAFLSNTFDRSGCGTAPTTSAVGVTCAERALSSRTFRQALQWRARYANNNSIQLTDMIWELGFCSIYNQRLQPDYASLRCLEPGCIGFSFSPFSFSTLSCSYILTLNAMSL